MALESEYKGIKTWRREISPLVGAHDRDLLCPLCGVMHRYIVESLLSG